MTNAYDSLLAEMDAEQNRAQQLRASMLGAVDANPDQEAEIRSLAQQYKLPTDGVRLTLPETRSRARFDAVDYDTLARELPATSALLGDPAQAKVAHDNVGNLSRMERAIRQLAGGAQEGAGMFVHGTGVLLDVGQRAAGRVATWLLPEPDAPGLHARGMTPQRATAESLAGPSKLGTGWQALGGDAKTYAREQVMLPADQQDFGDQVAAGLGQIVSQLGLVLAGGPAVGPLSLYAQGASVMHDKVKDDEAPQESKDLAIAAGAAITGFTEKWALDKLGVLSKPAQNALLGVLKHIGVAALSEGVQESAENVAHDALRQRLTNPDAEIQWVQSLDEGTVGAVVGGIARSVVEAGLHVRRRGQRRQQQAAQAESAAATLGEINEAASADKLLPRDRELFEQFAAHAADGGQLYIDAQALMQSGLAEPLAAASPAVAAQLQAAAATGGAIAIPAEEYVARIAPTELAGPLLEHLRADPDGLSLAEARAVQEVQDEQMVQEFEQAAAVIEEEAVRQDDQAAVRMAVQAELDAAGRFTPAANEAYATLTAAYYARRAEQMGLTAQELYERRQVRVLAEGVTGEDVLSQALASQPPTGGQHSTSGEAAGSGPAELLLQNTLQTLARKSKGSAQKQPASEPSTTAPRPLSGYQLDAQTPAAGEIVEGETSDGKLYQSAEAGDAQRQFAETERAYGGQAAYDKAKAEGKTKLNYRQWVQVRTPAFKQWFGDWEARTNATMQRRAATLEQAKQQAGAFVGRPIANRSTGLRATVSKTNLGKMSSRKAGDKSASMQDHALAIANADQLFTHALLDHSHADAKGEPTIAALHRYIAPMLGYDGILRAVKLTVKETTGPNEPNPIYSIEAMEIENPPSALSRANPDETGIHPQAGLSSNVVQRLAAVNGEGVSKAIDPDTGEPVMVEPHATDDNGAFSPENPNLYRQSARGFFNPQTLEIALLKNADLSTWLHESGHFFFENDMALAADLLAMQREGASLSEGELQLLNDVSALLTWHGLGGPLDEQLVQWHTLEPDARRAYHEKTAESFEHYLLEGQAPSLELAPYFQKFRAWLLNVYRSLKDFVARHPQAGSINPEVRAVFDRMLASDEQIRLAQAGRSMAPLFETAEQAGQVGMTVQAFEAYHAQGKALADEAAMHLQTRALRDLQWTRNAHGRELRKLQKQARALRAEAEIDARRAMMQEPLWRAARWLSNRITEEDKLPPEKRKAKKSTQAVNPETDSLLEAVTKLGGLDREAARQHLGVHPDEWKRRVMGKPVFRKTGGLSADAMAERLIELGYLADTDMHTFEDKVADELGGTPRYSVAHDWAHALQGEQRAGDEVADPAQLGAARLDAPSLAAMGLPPDLIAQLEAKGMVAPRGLHPDLVAELFGFSSGDELVHKLAAAPTLEQEVDDRAQEHLLMEHGELATPQALEREADRAIQGEVRARMVAAEADALARATGQVTGQRRVLAQQAKALAEAQVARVQVRHLRPSSYSRMQAKAAQEAKAAMRRGDLAGAGAAKRNEMVHTYAARAAHDALAEIDAGLRYLRKFEGDIKGLDADYADQIHALLERFDLRKGQSLKAIDKRASLAQWLESQREAGLEPEIDPRLENEALRKHYRNMSVEEFRGLLDTVRQIEHLGRLKNRLLTSAQQREFAAVRDELVDSIRQHAYGRQASNRAPNTKAGRWLAGIQRFGAAHIKAATWARIMDGGRDGGPVWEHFIRGANERANLESSMRAEATQRLVAVLQPLKALGRMGGSGQWFESIGRSLNREERLAMALNVGNAGNLQRLLDGEGWTNEQIAPVLATLTSAEWNAVQAVWDHFESYRPLIAAKERRVYGREPQWVEAAPLTVQAADGVSVQLRGGYYPVKYDPAASLQAEQHADAESAAAQLKGAYTSATTRRSFTKTRAEAVKGRPLLLSLQGVYSGVNEVIHDLAWHEWLIDANRLLRSRSIDAAIRDHYGAQVKQQLKTWVQDIAEGDKGVQNAGEAALAHLRQGVSLAGLGFNVVSAAMQPLGITQSIVRVGAPWVARGVARYVAHPVALAREVNEKSEFMRNRNRTRFRELNELRNMVQEQSAWQNVAGRYGYWLMMRFQQAVDVPTWQGAYEKALAAGQDEVRAVALADQAVIDAQGGGETKDLSAVERGGPAQRLFTVFYSFMNTALNMGAGQAMTAHTPARRAKLAADMLLLYTVPAVLGALLKDAITPGDGGDEENWLAWLAQEQLSYLLGLFFLGREFADAGKLALGADRVRDYSGPAGVRVIADTQKFITQAGQGEFDMAFFKASMNLTGGLLGLPSAQINRSVTGAVALAEGDTENPAALVLGHQRP